MSTDNIIKRAHPIASGFIIFFALIEFFITVILVSDYNRHDSYPNGSIRDRIRFLLFASIWSLVFSSTYLIGVFLAPANFLFSIASHAGFTFLSWIFWLAGAASWTDALGGTLSCGDLFLSNFRIDIGVQYCHSLRAVQAFAWLEC
ncbi:hypothetical protein CROQUDRAFT_49033 [Cronartium quercuum f. sp. fusiforme G11]|uniref:MARVEL domain-containing protein n=1 Tax=Cronartium quercuum f. sp. fusiforme G11 TaxID=708437 RepID=A0A9P6NGQ4_9BASI|nr:hypothetical protein CROQUDRAFT_49033 [Cronartium quercuum f. sp. fusiforme G11]